MKLLIRIGIFAAIIGILAYIKVAYLSKKDGVAAPTAANNAKTPPPSVGVQGYIVKAEKLDNKIFATGSILPSESVELKSEVNGKIVTLNINEGKYVKKGQLLVKLNDNDLQATLRKLQAQLKIAQSSEERLKKLLDIKGVSQDEYDIVINQINNIRADIDFTQAQIAKTEIYAPFDGVIGLREVSNGAYVTPQNRMATLSVVNQVKLDFTVPEKYANQVRIGDVITFYTEGGGTQAFNGKVYAAESQIDPVSRSLKLRATAANSSGKLHPGEFIKVNFNLKEIDNALMIPTEAIVPILKGQQVFVCRDGKATPTIIEVGVRTDTKIQVVQGIAVGDTVVTTGVMNLKANTPIKFSSVN